MLLVEKGRGGNNHTFGPMFCTPLEDTAVDALEHVELDELAVDGGEEKLFAVLDSRYPERERRIELAIRWSRCSA